MNIRIEAQNANMQQLNYRKVIKAKERKKEHNEAEAGTNALINQ